MKSEGKACKLKRKASALRVLIIITCIFTAGPEAWAFDDQKNADSSTSLEEIVVTAEKRDERLQDVPVPVTIIAGEGLLLNNQARLEDFYSSLPGLTLTPDGSGDVLLAIRGLTTGGAGSLSNPTVGILIDDVQFGSSTALGSFRTGAPDLDPSDLQRIEELRGPQGTLYGASSIGGLLKYVLTDPSTASLSGRVQADTTTVDEGRGPGYAFRAAVNVPITETFAIRVNGFTRHDPGYIDIPNLGVDGINKTDAEGGHIAALWKPSSNWSLKINAFYQDTDAEGGTSTVKLPGFSNLVNVQVASSASQFVHELQMYSATLKGSFYGFDLTALTGYGINKFLGNSDLTGGLGGLSKAFYGVSGAEQLESDRTAKFTQEIRIDKTFFDRVDWLVGLFYTHEDSRPDVETDFAVAPITGAYAGPLISDPYPTTYAEAAIFTDLTVHFTSQFDVQFGGRESENRQIYNETLSGPVFGATPTVQPKVHTDDHAFTYLVTPRYKFSDELMTYARFASGYRPGGPNSTCTVYAVPCHYEPDLTYNYELGIKGTVLDKRVSFDASVYYIDWKDIQITISSPIGLQYFTNAPSAKSEGLELSSEFRPFLGTTLGAWVDLSKAILTSDLPSNSSAEGTNGNPLPYSSHYSTHISADQDFSLPRSLKGNVGASFSYVGRRQDAFPYVGVDRYPLPAYGQLNLHGGVRFGEWTVNLFANNVCNERGLLSQTLALNVPGNLASQLIIPPRTVGISVSATF